MIEELINKKAQCIVENIAQESIDVYRFIATQFEKSDVSKDYIFQFVFRSFYRMDSAGLSKEFKDRYFELFQSVRGSKNLDMGEILNELYKFKSLNGLNTIQFSFVTKLANTIENTYPIYDSEVARMYGYRTPYTYKDKEERVSEYLAAYSELRIRYQAYIRTNSLSEAISVFDRELISAEDIPTTKKIDFLIWSAGKLKRAGKLIHA